MFFDKTADVAAEDQHEADGNNHGNDHDRQMLGHADSSDNGVERENDVEQQDLTDDRGKRRRDAFALLPFLPFQFLMDLARALGEKKQSAAEQNQIATREVETVPEQRDRE